MLANKSKVTRGLSSVLLGGALVLALGGCAREDQNTLLVFGPDSAVVVAPLTLPDFLLPPSGTGTASALELISFDPVALDAFGRSSEPFSFTFPRWYSGGYWSWGLGRDHVYDWDTGDVDTRLPALTIQAPLADPWRMYIAVPGAFAAEGYDMYGETCCLAANTNYVIGMERLALTVNGELDASLVLLGQPADSPDELSSLGGQPGGDYTRRADLFNTSNPYPAEANANPFYFGWAATDATGYLIIDTVVECTDAAGVQVWMCDDTQIQSLAPVAPNKQVRHGFPNYNYLTVWETNPDGSPNLSRPALRKQIGVDLSALGGPINNAYGPFPRAALSDAELALGTGGISRPADVTFEFENLKALDGSNVYKVWALDDAGAATALTFDYYNIDYSGTDPDTLDSGSAVAGFTGGPGVWEVMITYPDNAAYIMVSMESSSGAGTPSSAQILWARGLQEAGVPKSLDLDVDFGTFGDRVWDISGTGTGGLFGNEFRERYSQLPRPPVGYQYVGWLASGDTLFTRLPDESFTDGPPNYTVLTDADMDMDVSPAVQPTTLLTAFTRICLYESDTNCDGPYDLAAYDTFILTLEPKGSAADEIGPTRVLQALVPEPKPIQ